MEPPPFLRPYPGPAPCRLRGAEQGSPLLRHAGNLLPPNPAPRRAGAAEDTRNTPGRIYPRKRSLYTGGEGWSSPEALSVGQYVTYAYIAIPYDDLAPFQQDNPPGVLQFFPQELLEDAVQQHFDVTTRHLRSDSAYYDEARGGYVMPAGGGMGALPDLTYQYSQEGELLTITVTLDFPDAPDQQHTITVRLEPEGGWRYLSDEVGEAAG